ncbi:MAG: flippase-like domain-containing protein [Phycisphaerae bacterium]|nr:flippase-like domain-containing protein [Phycisphaerae bacterium]
MTQIAKKWVLRLLKLAVCAGALWYLSTKVSINDYVRLADSPDKQHVLVNETGDTLRVRDMETGQERDVPSTALAEADQLEEGQRAIEPGLRSIVRRADWVWTGWALLAVGPSVFIMGWRIRLLLATQQIPITYRDATLLTFAGNFFNFAMPGTTGGDLYKAYHIAKRTHKRAEGVTIVLLDRVIGLISFLLLAAGTIIVLKLLSKPMIGVYGTVVGYFMIAFIVASCLFFSRRVRRWIRYDALLQKLPLADKLRRIDETALSFRYHTWQTMVCLLGTLVNHFLIVTAIYFLAQGLGIHPRGDQTAGDLYMACLLAATVGFLFSAIPISFYGIGQMEAVFFKVLVEGGWSNSSQMVALTFGFRLIQIVWSLPGITVPWLGFGRPRDLSAEEDERHRAGERRAVSRPQKSGPPVQ